MHLAPYWNLTHQLFNPHLSSLVPSKIVLVEWQKHCFGLQNTRDLFFSEKKHPVGLHHTEVRIGDAATNSLPQSKYPNIQISNLDVPVGMVDGILTKPRNPVMVDGLFWHLRQPSLIPESVFRGSHSCMAGCRGHLKIDSL